MDRAACPACPAGLPACLLAGWLAARPRLFARAYPRTTSQHNRRTASRPDGQPATMPWALRLLPLRLRLLPILVVLPTPALRLSRPRSSCFLLPASCLLLHSLALVRPSLATRVAPFPTPCRAARPLNPVNNRPLPPPQPPRNQPPPHPAHPVPHLS